MLPYTSRNLPGNSGGQPSNVSLFGLAPDGVYQAFPVTWKTGALLPHRFTLTIQLLPIEWRSILCCTFLHVTATPRYGASCPMVFGLSSRKKFPSDRLARSGRNFNYYLHGRESCCTGDMKSNHCPSGPQYKAGGGYS